MGFKENLKDQLRYSGIYVKELAELTGIKKQTIDGYLNTHQNIPSAENAVKIAKTLGTSVEYLVTGMEIPAANNSEAAPRCSEARSIAHIAAGLGDKNRKMLLTIAKAMQRQDEIEKSQSRG